VPDNIILIGFMGAGKSTVGKLLARRLKREFIDVDSVIEEIMGMDIGQIFSKYGERYFRLVESKVVKEVLKGNGRVVACGGGVVLMADNIKALKQGGVVIYLRVNADEIYKRLSKVANRPLLNVKDRLSRIKELLRRREPLYLKAADIIVDAGGKSPEELVDEIIKVIKGC